jgi:hypothetical protein
MALDNLELVLELERKVDRLLALCQGLTGELDRLRGENQALLKEREGVFSELDRILRKLDGMDGEAP